MSFNMTSTREKASSQQPLSLEDRVRGIILSNVQQAAPAGHPSPSDYLPPHMLSASDKEKEDYLNQRSSRNINLSPVQPSGHNRKRPNQAQRRKMNTQYSVPVEDRTNPQNAFQGPAGSASYDFSHSANDRGLKSQPQLHTNNHPSKFSLVNRPPDLVSHALTWRQRA